MKRRQFLKMIPVGVLSGLIPGFLKAEPIERPFMIHDFKETYPAMRSNINFMIADEMPNWKGLTELKGQPRYKKDYPELEKAIND